MANKEPIAFPATIEDSSVLPVLESLLASKLHGQ